jgi:ATPase subunit of ABC transporter with duplicated ATPase domains
MSDDDDDNTDFISGALASVGLGAEEEKIDEDTLEYITGMLSADPFDEDTRDAVREILVEALSQEGNVDGVEVCESLFALLDISQSDSNNSNSNEMDNDNTNNDSNTPMLRKLSQTVTMKEQDEVTFASGLRVKDNDNGESFSQQQDERGGGGAGTSKIASFFANMIDVSDTEAMSERDRRKARQKEIRIKMEEEERQRAIDEAMNMFVDMKDGGDDGGDNKDKQQNEQRLLGKATETASDEAQMRDVRLLNFELPNLRGGGPNLLSGANLILARGRRYGLMGRNGCGKTTFLTALSQRKIDCDDDDGGVPTTVRMLLVRQEIIGNDWSAVDTVLKSDVKRESCKKYIEWIDKELDKIDNPTTTATATTIVEDDDKDDNDGNDKDNDGEDENKTKESPKDRRQRLKDRKKLSMEQRKALKDKKKKKAKSSDSTTTTTTETTAEIEANKEERRKKLRQQLVGAHNRLSEIESVEGGDPEPRARKVLAGLGFTPEMQDKPTSALSGGWRMRVSLSCALFANPSLLLLDEPTNHLDLEAVLWLERYLTKTFTGTLVVVSHDRCFLDEVVTDVVHFHNSSLTTYKGDISNYESVLIENKIRQSRQREQQEAKRAHLQKYIDLHAQAGENGVKASKQRKSKQKKLDKLGVMSQEGKKWKASDGIVAQEIEEVEEEEEVVLIFPDPGSFDKEMIQLEQVKFGYNESDILLEGVDLTIDLSSRVALLGRNGCGKR